MDSVETKLDFEKMHQKIESDTKDALKKSRYGLFTVGTGWLAEKAGVTTIIGGAGAVLVWMAVVHWPF